MNAETLLYRVVDRRTFVEFVEALSMERGMFPSDERDISAGLFLQGCLAFLDDKKSPEPDTAPTWRTFADLLYFGKFYTLDRPYFGIMRASLPIIARIKEKREMGGQQGDTAS